MPTPDSTLSRPSHGRIGGTPLPVDARPTVTGVVVVPLELETVTPVDEVLLDDELPLTETDGLVEGVVLVDEVLLVEGVVLVDEVLLTVDEDPLTVVEVVVEVVGVVLEVLSVVVVGVVLEVLSVVVVGVVLEVLSVVVVGVVLDEVLLVEGMLLVDEVLVIDGVLLVGGVLLPYGLVNVVADTSAANADCVASMEPPRIATAANPRINRGRNELGRAFMVGTSFFG